MMKHYPLLAALSLNLYLLQTFFSQLSELLHLYKRRFVEGLQLEDDKNRMPIGNTELRQKRTDVLCR